jgi:hypothetical protein
MGFRYVQINDLSQTVGTNFSDRNIHIKNLLFLTIKGAGEGSTLFFQSSNEANLIIIEASLFSK